MILLGWNSLEYVFTYNICKLVYNVSTLINININLMDEGKIAEVGTPEEVFGNPQNERTKEFLSKVL